MANDVLTRTRPLTKDALPQITEGWQVEMVSFRHPIRRGEALPITVDGPEIHIRATWAAQKNADGWMENHPISERLYINRCSLAEGEREDTGAIIINCPYKDITLVFYPPGHKKNISRQDVRPVPQFAGVAE